MKFEINSYLDGSVLFSLDADSLKLALEAGVKRDANLWCADLMGAHLRGANLMDAHLRDANLRSANLRDANLRDADLRGANLRSANLRGANLMGANLMGANLRDANLRDANLSIIRADVWAVLCAVPAEVLGLRQAILNGEIDGSAYEGACACLVGTLAKLRHCRYSELHGLPPDSGRPAERFFLAIKPGDTPETSQFSRLALEWVDQWLANMQQAFARKVTP